MIEYKVLADDPQKGLVVQGNFAPGSIPVNIPHSNPKRKQYISLFLNLRDIEAGIDYLQCISPNNHLRINEGLFISALALSAKCFVTSESRIGLDKQGFKKYSPQSKPIFDRYDAWRNKHFLHDENSMTEAIAFLLVSPAGSENVFGGSPSVVWNSVQVNYLQEGKQLESLLQEIRKYIMSSIDKKGDSIAQEYCNCTREEGFFVFDIATFNERVVREAILNAVSHRNYQFGGSIFVRQFRDRLVVESPGGLPCGITLDNILDRQLPRNRRIAEILSLCGMVERSGQGMNLMFELSVQEAKPLPDFAGTDDFFVSVTLNGLIIDKAMLSVINKISERGGNLLATEDFLTIDALYHERPLTEKMQARLNRLIEMGIVEHIGRKKYALAWSSTPLSRYR